MSKFENLRRIELTKAHVSAGFALSEKIGWNQAEADWAYMLQAGFGVGLLSENGSLVATALALPYDRFAWIGMVLVDPEFRRRGLATKLMDQVIAGQTAEGRVSGLDATPDGREVYRQIGFQSLYRLGRYRAENVPVNLHKVIAMPGISVRSMSAEELSSLLSIDEDVFGAGRADLLRHLADRVPGAAFVAIRDENIVGYVLARNGREAYQIGPVVAEETTVAQLLVASAFSGIINAASENTSLYIDVLEAKKDFIAWLQDYGFALQRPYIRMYQNRDQGFDDPRWLFAIAGPELG